MTNHKLVTANYSKEFIGNTKMASHKNFMLLRELLNFGERSKWKYNIKLKIFLKRISDDNTRQGEERSILCNIAW